MKVPSKKILFSGNEAMAEAAVLAGCDFYAGYPITPQNELIAYMAKRMRQEQRVFIQAESELAAINMVFGAAATGARAMTSSSSPGISLKQEGISYLAGVELPAVIINVMRGGPGLGNIASSQADYFQATCGGGHGDYFTPVVAPWSVQEAAELVSLAFDLADKYRNPVLVLADAIIGQMMEPAEITKAKSQEEKVNPDRIIGISLDKNAKVLKKPWALTGCLGRKPNIIRSLLLKEGALQKHNEKLRKKWELISEREQRFDSYRTEGARYLLAAYGSQSRIAKQAVDILRSRKIPAGLFRPISLWPYPEKGLKMAAKKAEKVLVVEQSLGQMVRDVRLALPEKEVLFLGKAGGGIPQAEEIVKFLTKKIA
ncbi:MAG: 3-methyl-2-oxobutanoate dehydrogenase subunit VorB [Candidatus Omnitrophica bacterium]|nr:3-methyl-2-oxobutanoate dehydrogenase subunit VorB [Candidatus Omnitrophota bacterium]